MPTALMPAPVVSVGAPIADTPCRTASPDLWFAEFPRELQIAQELCGGCPLQAACLEEARQRREPWGVWGGQIFVDGVVVAVKRGRGRPPKPRPGTTA